MAEVLGRRLYGGILKNVARVWNPTEIGDIDVLQRVLEHMQAGERGLRRLEAALDRGGPENSETHSLFLPADFNRSSGQLGQALRESYSKSSEVSKNAGEAWRQKSNSQQRFLYQRGRRSFFSNETPY